MGFPLLLLACGGESSSPGDAAASPNGDGQSGSSEASSPTTDSDPTQAPSLPFEPSNTYATRTPVGAGCNETNVPFTDADLFALQVVGSSTALPVRSIAIILHRNVEVGKAYALEVQKAEPGGQQQAQSKGSPIDGVRVFGGDPRSTAPLATPFDRATVTVLAFPTADGEQLEARVELHFPGHGTLDETMSAKLVSNAGACGGG